MTTPVKSSSPVLPARGRTRPARTASELQQQHDAEPRLWEADASRAVDGHLLRRRLGRRRRLGLPASAERPVQQRQGPPLFAAAPRPAAAPAGTAAGRRSALQDSSRAPCHSASARAGPRRAALRCRSRVRSVARRTSRCSPARPPPPGSRSAPPSCTARRPGRTARPTPRRSARSPAVVQRLEQTGGERPDHRLRRQEVRQPAADGSHRPGQRDGG